MVLLKNARTVLPLKAGANIAVVGPSSDTHTGLVAPYFGDFLCYMPNETKGNKTYDCVPTIGEKIAQANVGGTTTIVPGIDVDSKDRSRIAEAIAAAEAADVVVLALGIDSTVEHEGWDVPDITLPGLQLSFAKEILALQKPTVLVLTGDDGTGIDELIDGASAIVRTFYSGMQGSKALASLLFGEANRWGKLPVTMYPAGYTSQLPAMGEHTGTAYAMAHGPGRSYRYYTGTPLFKFGEGLSLTTFSFVCDSVAAAAAIGSTAAAKSVNVSCTVTNTGHVVGDEVLLVYHAVGNAIREKASKLHPVPLKALVEFDRVVDLAPQASQKVAFALDVEQALSVTTADGSKVVYPGEHQLIFSTGVPGVPDVVQTVTV